MNDEIPCGVVANALDCYIEVSDFELQPSHYGHFRINTLETGTHPPYPSSYGLKSTTTVFQQKWILL